jgi:hypothetical protein
MSQETAPSARPLLTLVCTGRTYLTTGKIGLVLREVQSDDSLGSERIYQRKGLEHLRVGAVYQVEADSADLGSIYTRTIRWLRLWGNTEEAAIWQLAAEAFDTRHLAAQQERKQNARKLPLEVLSPVRDEYRRTNPAGRLAIEVRLLAYLRQVRVSSTDHD